MLRLFFSFWAVMSAAGLVVDLLFRAVGIAFPTRRTEIAATRFEWNYTTFLNIAFLGVAALVYWAYRNRAKLGGGGQYAKDPVCGMQVERDNPGATSQHDGHTVYFCADRCKDKFLKEPTRYTTAGHDGGGQEPHAGGAQVTDPVCEMAVYPDSVAGYAIHGRQDLFFCSQGCADTLAGDPVAYVPGAELAQPAGRPATA